MEEKDLLPEEEDNKISLTDENGDEYEFEVLAIIEHEEKEYILLVQDESNEVIIMEIVPAEDGNDSFLTVEDEDILNAVYDTFKKLYKDEFTFED